MQTETPQGSNMSALCPLCNAVYCADRLYMTDFICPMCGKKIGKSAIIYAYSAIQSYQLAMALKEERESK